MIYALYVLIIIHVLLAFIIINNEKIFLPKPNILTNIITTIPTTIVTIPTAIITEIPSTIPTTILTTIPTTITPTIPTTILTTIPTTIGPSIPTIILNASPTTILTTFPTTILTLTTIPRKDTFQANQNCHIEEILKGNCKGKMTNEQIREIYNNLKNNISADSNQIIEIENVIF